MGKLLLFIIAVLAVAYVMPAPGVHVETSIEIDSPRTQVWEVMSNLTDLPRWNASAFGMEFDSNQRQGVGAIYEIEGAPVSHRYQISKWEPYNRIDLQVMTKPRVTVDHIVRYSIHPRGSRTIVRFTEDYVARGGYLGYIFDRVAYYPSRGKSREPALANLKRLVETGQGIFIR